MFELFYFSELLYTNDNKQHMLSDSNDVHVDKNTNYFQ